MAVMCWLRVVLVVSYTASGRRPAGNPPSPPLPLAATTAPRTVRGWGGLSVERGSQRTFPPHYINIFTCGRLLYFLIPDSWAEKNNRRMLSLLPHPTTFPASSSLSNHPTMASSLPALNHSLISLLQGPQGEIHPCVGAVRSDRGDIIEAPRLYSLSSPQPIPTHKTSTSLFRLPSNQHPSSGSSSLTHTLDLFPPTS